MTAINLLSSKINISSLKALDASKLEVQKLSPEMVVSLDEIWKNQFRIPVGKADNDPDNVYATVKVGGKVVATIYNSGAAVTANSDYGKIQKLPSMGQNEQSVGPELAQKRAEEIAGALGGNIEKSATAKTAAEWQPAKIEWSYDYARMEAARNALEASNSSARTRLDAQILGQGELFS